MIASFVAIALAIASGAQASYADAPTTCAAYECPSDYVAKVDAGFGVCPGPCTPEDCCDPIPEPTYTPRPTYTHTPIETVEVEAPKCTPLRTADNKCVVKGDFDEFAGEWALTVGKCSDKAVVEFCDCELATADNLCLSTSEDSEEAGAAVVLRACENKAPAGQAWEYLAKSEDGKTYKYYFENGNGLYLAFDAEEDTLVQAEDATYLFLEKPCTARIVGKPIKPAPIPAPAVRTCKSWNSEFECGSYGLPTYSAKVQCGSDRDCLAKCCEAVPEPITTCAAFTCPDDMVLKVDAGFGVCPEACTPVDCCDPKIEY